MTTLYIITLIWFCYLLVWAVALGIAIGKLLFLFDMQAEAMMKAARLTSVGLESLNDEIDKFPDLPVGRTNDRMWIRDLKNK